MNRPTRFCPALMLALLAACSSYSGRKLGYDPATKTEIPVTGLPYRLVRPEYSLAFVPPAAGETKPTFTVKVSYEPDPNQFYSLNVKPGYFTDPDFTMAFGTGGTLTGAKAGFTEQLTPAIKAIGSFAANLAALGVFDEASLQSQLSAAIDSADCTGSSGAVQLDQSSLRLIRPDVPTELKGRLAKLEKAEVIRNRFHYVSEAERVCLERARDRLKTPRQQRIDAAKSGYDPVAQNYPPTDKEFAEDVTKVITTNNRERFKLIQRDQAALATSSPGLHALRKPLVDKAEAVMLAQQPNDTLDALDLFVDMDDATWRARHLLYLEDEIAGATLALQRHPQASAATRNLVFAHVAGLERARADTIGATDLHLRRQRLRALLDRLPMSARGSGATSAEYTVARTELELATQQIDALRTKVLAAAKKPEPKAASAFKDVPAVRVTAKDIAESVRPGWDGKIHKSSGDAGVAAPPFVIVLEPLP